MISCCTSITCEYVLCNFAKWLWSTSIHHNVYVTVWCWSSVKSYCYSIRNSIRWICFYHSVCGFFTIYTHKSLNIALCKFGSGYKFNCATITFECISVKYCFTVVSHCNKVNFCSSSRRWCNFDKFILVINCVLIWII